LEPTFDDYVRIALGGAQNPTHLMSHDWHTEDKGTPWHQNHVRNGYVSNGPWAVDVAVAGRYRVTLRRWPAALDRAMGCTRAALAIAGQRYEQTVAPTATAATFEVELPAGPAMLQTTLRRASGEEHGAYFAEVARLD
ncbi:MAG: N-acetylgalactosamine 6-sulfate sulfatase (GALNS), partial [Planctomycetota bacterium]